MSKSLYSRAKEKLFVLSMRIIELCVICKVDSIIKFIIRIAYKGSRKMYVSRAITMAQYVEMTKDVNSIEYVGQLPVRQLIYSLPQYDDSDTENEIHTVEATPNYIAKLHNITIISTSNLLITSDGYGINDMFVEDTTRRIRFYSRAFSGTISNKKIISIVPQSKLAIIEKGVMLSANFSSNYFHFTIEILPRFQYINDCVPQDVPLLIDSSMTKYPQFAELLSYFNQNNREIIIIESDHTSLVKELYYPSISPFVAPDVKSLSHLLVTDCLYDTDALDFLRSRLLPVKSVTKYPRKIFLYRQGGWRNFNQDEVFETLKPLGFEKISTDKMSVSEQIALFNGANIIVTGSGAGLTNILYCSKGCRIFIITRSTFAKITLYSTIASYFGFKLRYISAGNPVLNSRLDPHKDFEVDPQIIRKLIG